MSEVAKKEDVQIVQVLVAVLLLSLVKGMVTLLIIVTTYLILRPIVITVFDVPQHHLRLLEIAAIFIVIMLHVHSLLNAFIRVAVKHLQQMAAPTDPRVKFFSQQARLVSRDIVQPE